MLTPLSDPPPGPRPPLPAAAAEQHTHTKWPPSSLRRRLAVAGLAAPPWPRGLVPGRCGPAGPPRRPVADPGRWYAGPAEFGGPKGTKGSRDEAAGSHFVVSVLGLGLVHPERGAGWAAVGVRRAGRGPRLQAPWRAAGWRSGAAGYPAGSVQPPRGASEGPVMLALQLRLISSPFCREMPTGFRVGPDAFTFVEDKTFCSILSSPPPGLVAPRIINHPYFFLVF